MSKRNKLKFVEHAYYRVSRGATAWPESKLNHCPLSRSAALLEISHLFELGEKAGEGLEALLDLEGSRVLAEEFGQFARRFLQFFHPLFQNRKFFGGVLKREGKCVL